MTTYRGHYLPVAARREVLRIYRDRRVNGALRLGPRLSAVESMQATVHYLEGWLAHAVAFGPVGRHGVKDLTDQYRAAEFYLERLYLKPREFRDRRTSYFRVQWQRELRRERSAEQ
jgi:hypothetical protein